MLMTRRGREQPGDKTQGVTRSYPFKVALSLGNLSKSFSKRTVGFIPATLSLLGGGSLVKVHWVYLWDQRVWSQTMSRTLWNGWQHLQHCLLCLPEASPRDAGIPLYSEEPEMVFGWVRICQPEPVKEKTIFSWPTDHLEMNKTIWELEKFNFEIVDSALQKTKFKSSHSSA